MSRITDAEGRMLFACPDPECPGDDDNGGFWANLEEDYCDDGLGGHTVYLEPEDATCPTCGVQGIAVETEDG